MNLVMFLECGLPKYIGDGYCDDDNNKEGCNFDEGDCCGANVKKDFCNTCQCLENPTGTIISSCLA